MLLENEKLQEVEANNFKIMVYSVIILICTSGFLLQTGNEYFNINKNGDLKRNGKKREKNKKKEILTYLLYFSSACYVNSTIYCFWPNTVNLIKNELKQELPKRKNLRINCMSSTEKHCRINIYTKKIYIIFFFFFKTQICVL